MNPPRPGLYNISPYCDCRLCTTNYVPGTTDGVDDLPPFDVLPRPRQVPVPSTWYRPGPRRVPPTWYRPRRDPFVHLVPSRTPDLGVLSLPEKVSKVSTTGDTETSRVHTGVEDSTRAGSETVSRYRDPPSQRTPVDTVQETPDERTPSRLSADNKVLLVISVGRTGRQVRVFVGSVDFTPLPSDRHRWAGLGRPGVSVPRTRQRSSLRFSFFLPPPPPFPSFLPPRKSFLGVTPPPETRRLPERQRESTTSPRSPPVRTWTEVRVVEGTTPPPSVYHQRVHVSVVW